MIEVRASEICVTEETLREYPEGYWQVQFNFKVDGENTIIDDKRIARIDVPDAPPPEPYSPLIWGVIGLAVGIILLMMKLSSEIKTTRRQQREQTHPSGEFKDDYADDEEGLK